MAIGLGRMFGFRFPENFRCPYIADSVQEFWRRWHISLSTWFRDYLYIPLGGNRVSAAPALREPGDRLLPVRPLARRELDLRHLGAVARLVPRPRARHVQQRTPGSASRAQASAHGRSGRMLYTLAVVMIGWVFFRADTLPGAIAFLKAMAGARRRRRRRTPCGGISRPSCGSHWRPVPSDRRRGCRRWPRRLAARAGQSAVWTGASSLLSSATLTALLVASIMHVAARTYNPFIYFRF